MQNKSLGQHWLKDRLILEAIADCADLQPTDTVLEIGPGLGTLTSVLLGRAERVVAVEFDEKLASKLSGQFPGKQLTVYNQDILTFNTDKLPHVYKVVANVPYYITSKIVQRFSTCTNMPESMTLLVQKEVAERIVAEPGDMSILAVSAQLYWEVSLGPIVGAEWFTPPPKVDSRVVMLKRREQPLVDPAKQKVFFRVVKAGFSERRKKLRSALAGGLAMEKTDIDTLLARAKVSPEARAQELSIEQWQRLAEALA
ncbi:MAG TPA: 16S rRNA (adenine(1518)-N(6)/adenine(1519)-N(6))-dimethyltransferase RsmA [Candidatus Saccharibacteria bacterium]|nr:16S rRNA (adenine(1518)-N(6)/adenine(1519)-N(6))-dimethyltransferase RsmA [Candidatus Saccharibacteria bacterium]